MNHLLTMVLICSLSALAGTPAPAKLASLAQQAEARFQLGLGQLETEPAKARDSFADAAEMFELLAQHPRTRESAARRNAANAWLLAGDPGRAILNYRRALLLTPGDNVARSGLREARSEPITRPVAGPRPGSLPHLRDQLAIERRAWLWIALVAANAGFWIAAARHLSTASARSRRTAWAAGAGVIGLIVVLLWSQGARPGVITAQEVVGRQGNSVIYQPAWRSPLGNGVEFSLMEQRDDWWKIRLADGSTGWIPDRSAALIHSPADLTSP